jgi:hypothetical protein
MRQEHIDTASQTDVALRHNPPSNPDDRFAQECLHEIKNLLGGTEFLMRHCTRLCSDERRTILASGIQALSPQLLHQRLDKRVEVGDLTNDQAAVFRSRIQTVESTRLGRAWWVAGMSLLADEGGVHRLLRHWGGEALYAEFESHSAGQLLRTIGEPTIVEARIPYENLDAMFPIERRMRDAIAAGEPLTFVAMTVGSVSGPSIHQLVAHGTDRFERLTNESKWHWRL